MKSGMGPRWVRCSFESSRKRDETALTLSAKSCLMQCSKKAPSFDDLVGKREQRRWHIEAEHARGLEIDYELEFRRLHDRQIGRLLALEDAACVETNLLIDIRDVDTVGHQAASLSKFTKLIHGRQRISRRQGNNAIPARVEEGSGGYCQRADALLRGGFECRLNVP